MRALFVTLPEKSHLFCMTPVAWALAAAGHEVRAASSPQLTDTITRTGLTAVPVGPPPDMHEGMAHNRESQESEFTDWNNPDDEQVWEDILLRYKMCVGYGFVGYNEPMMDELVEFSRRWRPDLVVWDALAYAAPLAAHAVGAAHVRNMCWADVWGGMRRSFLRLRDQAPGERTEDPMAEWLGEQAATRFGGGFTEDMVTGQATIDSLPEALGARTGLPRIPVRYVPYNGSAVVDPWLREPPARPRICLTLGSSNFERFGGDYVSISDLLDSLADLDIEVVAALVPDQRAGLRRIPRNVRVVQSVALNLLLPTCSAVIHHGGFGTYSTALVCGVPQLIVTTTISDHVLRGRTLTAEGAGLYLMTDQLTAAGLRERVIRLLNEPAFLTNALRLREDSLAHPTPHDIVPTLVDLVAEHRR